MHRYNPSGSSRAAQAARLGVPLFQQASLKRSPSYRLRGLLNDVVGTSFDRDPCPHVERTREVIAHPMFPDRPHRTVVQVTDAPCIRPGAHRHSQDAAERLHADDTGATWS